MSTDWENVDDAGRVRRATYTFGSIGVATTTAIDLGGGRLVLLSPPTGDRAQPLLTALDELGEVVAIVAPNGNHRLGIPGASVRYPHAGVFAPPTALKRVQRALGGHGAARPLSELTPDLPGGIEIFAPPHMKGQDAIARVHTPGGAIWTVHDILVNFESLPAGVGGWFLGLLGFGTGLAVNRFGARFVLLRDRPAFSRWLLQELERVPVTALVTGHGRVARDPAVLATLPALAEEIGRI